MTRHGIYPSLPAPNGVPWSEYVKMQRNRSRSVSSSTEALESDHARYITRRIAQHARSMATGTRSLPTDSSVPFFQPIERGPISEGRLSDLDLHETALARGIHIPPRYVNPWDTSAVPGGIGYQPVVTESDRISTYTGLDDYDTLFATRLGRGALDQVPQTGEQTTMTTSVGLTPPTLSMGLMADPLERMMPAHDIVHSGQKEHTSIAKDPLKPRVASPSSEIIGEGAAIFTDMTETILDALDQQLAVPSKIHNPKDMPINNDLIKGTHGRTQMTSDQKASYPDLFLPVAENHSTSDHFCGYQDSLSVDNNPMVLVELNSLSY